MISRARILPGLFLLAACSSSSGGTDNGPIETLVLALLEGSGQTAIGHTAVGTAPAVRLTVNGAPRAGVPVTFSVTQGGGVVTQATPSTDADGIARVGSWVLGDPGTPQELRATVANAQGSPVTFTATATAGPAATLAMVAGDNQSVTVGQAAPVKPVVRVTDVAANPVAGAAVSWQVTTGNGSVLAPDAVTGADGTATVGNWVFGQIAGAQALEATACATCGTVTFNGTATPGAVASIEKLAGDFQSALAGTAVPVAPRVLLKDLFGNLVPGQVVTFAVTQGGGSVTGGTPASAADGTASVGSWMLGATPGENKLDATVGATSVTFTATGTSGFNPAQYVGTYAGTWTNTTFASMGTGTVVIAVNSGAQTATVTASATGNVLGSGSGANPGPQNGGYTNTGAAFNATLAPMGDISATIQSDGTITAVGSNVPNPSITGWTATGTITATTISLNFTVTFTSGPPAVGTITLTRQ